MVSCHHHGVPGKFSQLLGIRSWVTLALTVKHVLYKFQQDFYARHVVAGFFMSGGCA